MKNLTLSILYKNVYYIYISAIEILLTIEQRFSNCGSQPNFWVVVSFFSYIDCKTQAHSSYMPNY
jgi:hypothetical protein